MCMRKLLSHCLYIVEFLLPLCTVYNDIVSATVHSTSWMEMQGLFKMVRVVLTKHTYIHVAEAYVHAQTHSILPLSSQKRLRNPELLLKLKLELVQSWN